MKAFLLSLIILFNLSISYAAKNVLVKANVIKGESFVTVNTNPIDVEKIIKKAFKEKGFEVLEEIKSNESILYVDLFIFQFPADYPSITLTVRSENGINYIDKESVKIFGDRNLANLNLATKLAARLPSEIDINTFYEPKLKDLLSNKRISLIGLSANAITEASRNNYSSIITWPDTKIPDFILPNEFDVYAAYTSNYLGIRKVLKGKSIKLKLKINKASRFEILEIESPIKLDEKQENRLKEFINSFPLWCVKNEIESIEMVLNID